MSKAASFLIICAIFIVHTEGFILLFLTFSRATSFPPSPSQLVDIEVVDWTGSNKECWERGGTPLLMCEACADEGSLRGGVVKLAKAADQTLSAYNFGFQFASLTDGTKSLNLSDEVDEALRNETDAEETVYLKFNEKNETWVLKPRNESLGTCGVVYGMNCLQTVILSDEVDYLRFNLMGCREIRGDLIILNFQFFDQFVYPALDRLERITGRLIIHGCVGDVDLTFNSLTELKSQDVSLNDPILQITRNTVHSISFPKLKTIGNDSVVIGENVDYWNNAEMANISVNGKLVNTVFVADKMIKEPKREKFVFKEGMTEKDLIAKNVWYVVRDLRKKLIKDHWFVYLVPCVLLAVALLGFTIYSIKFKKKANFDFDLDAVAEKDPGEEVKKRNSKEVSLHKK